MCLKEELNNIYDKLISMLEKDQYTDKNKIFKDLFDYLLKIKENLINKKIKYELQKKNKDEDILLELNDYIKMITELEGKYNKYFIKGEYKSIEKMELIKELLIDKSFIKKIIEKENDE